MTVLSRFIQYRGGADVILFGLPLEGETLEERACNLLNRTGCRMWMEGAQTVVAYWPDLDGPELRTAIRTLDESIELRSLKSNFVPIDRRNRDLPLRFSGESLSDWLVRSAKVSRALNEAA
jgi:hypothetical protein